MGSRTLYLISENWMMASEGEDKKKQMQFLGFFFSFMQIKMLWINLLSAHAFPSFTVHTVFVICDSDQHFLLLPNRGSIRRLALGISQHQTKLLVLFVDGVVHQPHHTQLLGLT